MIYRKHKYLHPEPGDTSGTGTAPEPVAATPSTEPPASTVVETAPSTPEPRAIERSDKPAETSTRIGSLLDDIGKPEGESAAKESKPDKPADGEKPADKPEAKEKPEDNEPPEEASPRAKSRWMELSERAKQVPELERRATEAETQLTSVRQMVAESGLEQNEFAGMLQMGRLFKSSRPEDLQAAMAELDGLRADLATRLGIDAPGVDPLAKHADLAADVENMAISRERALEIAKLRDGQARVQQTQRQTQEMVEFQNTVKGAATQMDAALAQRASTPGHAAKVEFIKSQLSDPAKMQQFVSTYRPDQWQAVVLTMYDAYTAPAAPAPASPQPLRSGAVASGVRQAGNRPVTSQEAIGNAWELAGL